MTYKYPHLIKTQKKPILRVSAGVEIVYYLIKTCNQGTKKTDTKEYRRGVELVYYLMLFN